MIQSGRPDLNWRSCAPEARGIPGFPTSCCANAQRELNPHFRHGKAAGCRYIMGALSVPDCQRTIRAPGGTRTLVTALRVRYPCRWTTSAITSVGPEGLEPSPGGLRVRCAAANTLIPCLPDNRRGRNRTLGLALIRGLLSPLSYAPSVGPKGLEPLLAGLKVRCAAVTPRPPNAGRAYAFPSSSVHAFAPRFQW